MKIIMVWVLVMSGMASRYAPGKMMEPIYNRSNGFAAPAIRDDWQGFDGYAAARYPSEINSEYLVCPFDRSLPCLNVLIVDCAGIKDGGLQWMYDTDVVLEMNDEAMRVQWKKPTGSLPVNVYKFDKYITLDELVVPH